MPQTPAVLFPARNQVSFEPVTVPETGPDDVLVRTTWSWISNGTEGSFLRGERVDGETPWHPGDREPFPIVAGYQRVGTIEALGTNVTGLSVGETVFVTVSRVEGLYADHGGHFLLAPAHRSQIWRLPADLDPRAASGLVLTQVGFNCGNRPTVSPGDAAVVVGDGMVGQWAAQTLQAKGARVALVGRHPSRLGLFQPGEGGLAINQKATETVEAVRAWAPEGVQAVVDTVFGLSTTLSLFPLLRHNGHLVSAGFLGDEGHIDIQMLRKREATLHNPSGWSQERMDTTLAWIADGRLRTLDLVTHTFPAERAADAWRTINEERATTLGVLLDWRHL